MGEAHRAAEGKRADFEGVRVGGGCKTRDAFVLEVAAGLGCEEGTELVQVRVQSTAREDDDRKQDRNIRTYVEPLRLRAAVGRDA